MKKTSKFSRFFSFLWLEDGPADPVWDEMLNLLMDNGIVTEVTEYVITFNNKYLVWIGNHPFTSGDLWKIRDEKGCLNNPEFVCRCNTTTKIRLEDFYYTRRVSVAHPLSNDLKQLKNQ